MDNVTLKLVQIIVLEHCTLQRLKLQNRKAYTWSKREWEDLSGLQVLYKLCIDRL